MPTGLEPESEDVNDVKKVQSYYEEFQAEEWSDIKQAQKTSLSSGKLYVIIEYGKLTSSLDFAFDKGSLSYSQW